MTKLNMVELFDGMTVEEMKETLKVLNTECKTFIKEISVKEKETELVKIKTVLKEGMTVNVKYKDEVISGEIVSLRDKTFSIVTSDILNIKGEPSKVSRNYNLVILETPVTEESTEDSE